MFQVEFWNNSDYVYHWEFECCFDTLQEAIDYCKNQRGTRISDWRVIQVMWNEEIEGKKPA